MVGCAGKTGAGPAADRTDPEADARSHPGAPGRARTAADWSAYELHADASLPGPHFQTSPSTAGRRPWLDPPIGGTTLAGPRSCHACTRVYRCRAPVP